MYLGIEIGGTKLQLGVGGGEGPPCDAFLRLDVDPRRNAAGIQQQIAEAGRQLIAEFPVEAIGYGFGGPINSSTGIVTKSHQVAGWDGFPLAAWTEKTLGRPAYLGNDCDMAALAEARFGAGRGKSRVFYVTVGTGIGGGLVIDGRLEGSDRPAIAEIGHLRPGLDAVRPEQTVESIASGRGIEAAARGLGTFRPEVTAKLIAEGARAGDSVCLAVMGHACQALGWAIAQTITLLAIETVIVGGGVSLAGEQVFFEPLRAEVDRYVFPPLRDSYEIVPPKLGEEVVVHGAIALAAARHRGQ